MLKNYIISRFFFSASEHELSPQYKFECVLAEFGLSHYLETFLLAGIADIHSLTKLQLDDALFDELEMHVPAHRKRLKKAGSVFLSLSLCIFLKGLWYLL